MNKTLIAVNYFLFLSLIISENGDDFVSDSQSVFFYSKHPNIVLGSYNHSALEANQLVEDGLEKDSYNQSRIKNTNL